MKIEWKKLAAQMRGEIDRAKVSRTQARVLEVLVKATLMRGRQSVIIPRLEDLGAVLRLSKGKLSEAFNGQVAGGERLPGLGMTGFRMVMVRELTATECRERLLPFGAAQYTVMPDAQQWAVEWVYDRAALQTFLQGLDAVTGQVQAALLPAEMTLDEARAEVSVETARSRNGNETVPLSGTGPPVNGLTVPRLTASPELLNGEQLTALQENKIFHDLRQFVGEVDVRDWGGDWRKNWIRKHPTEFKLALRMLSDDARGGWEAHKSRAAALKDLTRRLVADAPK